MKRCPNCGEILMDATSVCPVCGYQFENCDMGKRMELEKHGQRIETTNGGEVLFQEELFVKEYPPFLEGIVPAIKIMIRNISQGKCTLIISAEIEKYAYEDKKTIVLESGEDYEYTYVPVFKKESMKDLSSYGKSVLKYSISGDLKNPIFKKESILILSYGDILWNIDGTSLAPYIVKWVTPRDDVIRNTLLNRVMDEMESIKEIADYLKNMGFKKKGMIVGEQLGKIGIYAQVWALFNALKKWGIRYKSTPVSILEGYQRVKLPKEVLREKGGNCIDLTVTFASALEAMELAPAIVLIPGHAFPGVYIPTRFVDAGDGAFNRSFSTRKYDSILKKYSVFESRDASGDAIEILDSNLRPCCGGYILSVEATMIPDSSFMEAVENISTTGKMDKIEEIILVPEVRKELNILPYEDINISVRKR